MILKRAARHGHDTGQPATAMPEPTISRRTGATCFAFAKGSSSQEYLVGALGGMLC
jgi:hypothetical protein